MCDHGLGAFLLAALLGCAAAVHVGGQPGPCSCRRPKAALCHSRLARAFLSVLRYGRGLSNLMLHWSSRPTNCCAVLRRPASTKRCSAPTSDPHVLSEASSTYSAQSRCATSAAASPTSSRSSPSWPKSTATAPGSCCPGSALSGWQQG